MKQNPNFFWHSGCTTSISLFLFMLFVLHANTYAQAWQKVEYDPNSSVNNYCIVFTDSLHGWIGLDAAVRATTDGGKSWQSYALPAPFPAKSLRFCNNLEGYVLADSSIYKSTDGGKTWAKIYTADTILNVIYTYQENNVWASGKGGRLLHSGDKGKSWTKLPTATTLDIGDISFIDSLHGWAQSTQNQYIFSTTDGGNTWAIHKKVISFGAQFKALYIINATKGWLVGGPSTIAATTNGGQLWKAQNAPNIKIGTQSNLLYKLNAVHFVDEWKGWAVGTGGVIVQTNDGGETWAVQKNGISDTDTSFGFNSVQMLSANSGWAVGSKGIILRYAPVTTGVENEDKDGIIDYQTIQSISSLVASGNTIRLPLKTEYSGNVGISVYSLQGVALRQWQQHIDATGNITLELPDTTLPEGMYVARLTGLAQPLRFCFMVNKD